MLVLSVLLLRKFFYVDLKIAFLCCVCCSLGTLSYLVMRLGFRVGFVNTEHYHGDKVLITKFPNFG